MTLRPRPTATAPNELSRRNPRIASRLLSAVDRAIDHLPAERGAELADALTRGDLAALAALADAAYAPEVAELARWFLPQELPAHRALLRAAELAAQLQAADAADALAEGYRARPPIGWEALRSLRQTFDEAESEARRIGSAAGLLEEHKAVADAAGVQLADAAARLDLRP